MERETFDKLKISFKELAKLVGMKKIKFVLKDDHLPFKEDKLTLYGEK